MFILISLGVRKFPFVLFHSVFKICSDPSVELTCSVTQLHMLYLHHASIKGIKFQGKPWTLVKAATPPQVEGVIKIIIKFIAVQSQSHF